MRQILKQNTYADVILTTSINIIKFTVKISKYITIYMKKSIFAGLLLTSGFSKFTKQEKHEEVLLPLIPEASIDTLYQSTGRLIDANIAESEGLKKAQKSITTPVRSINSLFLRLPSREELEKLILGADSAGILKTIQTVASDDSLPCSQRITYLLEVLGRIRCISQKKQFRADQFQVIIQGAFSEIKRLEAEIIRLEDQKIDLWLEQFREDLGRLIQDLESVYNQFNSIQIELPPIKVEITGLNNQISLLTDKSDSQRNRIAQNKLKITEVEAYIRDIRRRLQEARDRKFVLEQSIRKSEKIITENDENISYSRKEIKKLYQEIDELQDKTDSLRGQATFLEILVERLRTDIAIFKQKQAVINQEIDEYAERINSQKKKIVQEDVNNINRKIDTLKKLIPTTESSIDHHYYYCYGDGSIKEDKSGGVVVYIIKGEKFGEYIHNAYGKKVKAPIVYGDVRLSRVDLFGLEFTSQFGHVFPDPSFKRDFGCLNPSAARKGSGKIVSIKAGQIETLRDGRIFRFRLGSCTRLQSTANGPKVGQSIFYSEVNGNLYQATCGDW